MDDGRRMVYPVTSDQKLKHFPYKFHFKYVPGFKQMTYSILLCIPVFYWIQKATYSEQNVRKYEEYLEKEKKEHEHHMHKLEKYYEDTKRH